jgi:hypothetical protein
MADLLVALQDKLHAIRCADHCPTKLRNTTIVSGQSSRSSASKASCFASNLFLQANRHAFTRAKYTIFDEVIA